ncbi:unnamed protein product, partial [Allacma fusca]
MSDSETDEDDRFWNHDSDSQIEHSDYLCSDHSDCDEPALPKMSIYAR